MVVLDVCVGSWSEHSWNNLELHFGEVRSVESWGQWCSTPPERLCSCTGTLFASLRAQTLSQGASSFLIAGQSLRLVIIRKVCADSFRHKCQTFTPLLDPSLCFPPGIPCRICGWRDSFGNVAVPSWQPEPANTSGGTGDVLPQPTLRVHSHLYRSSAVTLFCWSCCWRSAISKNQ